MLDLAWNVPQPLRSDVAAGVQLVPDRGRQPLRVVGPVGSSSDQRLQITTDAAGGSAVGPVRRFQPFDRRHPLYGFRFHFGRGAVLAGRSLWAGRAGFARRAGLPLEARSPLRARHARTADAGRPPGAGTARRALGPTPDPRGPCPAIRNLRSPFAQRLPLARAREPSPRSAQSVRVPFEPPPEPEPAAIATPGDRDQEHDYREMPASLPSGAAVSESRPRLL